MWLLWLGLLLLLVGLLMFIAAGIWASKIKPTTSVPAGLWVLNWGGFILMIIGIFLIMAQPKKKNVGISNQPGVTYQYAPVGNPATTQYAPVGTPVGTPVGAQISPPELTSQSATEAVILES